MSPLRATFAGGLVAGLLDITYACAHYGLVHGTPPQRILQSVAAGVLGPTGARAGGWGSAVLGMTLHLAIAMLMAAAFVAAAGRIAGLRRWPAAWAVAYGLLLYAVMNYLVVPYSRAGNGAANPPEGQFFWGALFAHIVLVALPIVLAAGRVRRGV